MRCYYSFNNHFINFNFTTLIFVLCLEVPTKNVNDTMIIYSYLFVVVALSTHLNGFKGLMRIAQFLQNCKLYAVGLYRDSDFFRNKED